MPRDLPVGNGALLVNFDSTYQLRDLYWPCVGQENHTAGHPFRFGVWLGGQFRWVDDPQWQRSLKYRNHTLVTEVSLTHPAFPLTLECHDLVDFHEDLYLRQVVVRNHSPAPQEVRLFFAQDFHINGHAIGDSAYYEPERRAVFHYKGKSWFMVNGARLEGDQWVLGLQQWAIGLTEQSGHEGTWRDAEDGLLSGNAAAQGNVDSCVALHLQVPAQGAATAWYWVAVAADFQGVTRINRAVREKGPPTFLDRTQAYWQLWCTKDGELPCLAESLEDLYQRSLLTLRAHIDNGGAVIAATDFDNARAYSDTYAYMWPRDGALVAAALVEAGYSEPSQRFFAFCHRVITPEGYLLHKYNPDGSLASSWHAWAIDGHKALPVQEDETALVLWALWRHFARFRDVEFIKPLYRGLIIRAASWLVSYRDQNTGLPLPSWDLWEEQRGVFAWTVGAVWGGLQAAANFAAAFGEAERAATFRQTADQLRQATLEHLWDAERSCFAGQLLTAPEGLVRDHRAESSVVGLWQFGMFPADDPRIATTMAQLRDRLWVKTDLGGIARYEDDHYHQVSRDLDRVPGNPWFICTLWLAQWHIATARTAADLIPARDLLEWVAARALPSGVLAEQLDPYTGEPLSVSPLTWSHAAVVATVRSYLTKHCQADGSPDPAP
jgi:glucoamylase